jgi:hypothetical protein
MMTSVSRRSIIMRKGLIAIATAASIAAGFGLSSPAAAQYHGGGHDRAVHRGWENHDRGDWRHHREWRDDRRWRHHHHHDRYGYGYGYKPRYDGYNG